MNHKHLFALWVYQFRIFSTSLSATREATSTTSGGVYLSCQKKRRLWRVHQVVLDFRDLKNQWTKKVGKNGEDSVASNKKIKSPESIQTRKAVAWVYVGKNTSSSCVWPCQSLVAMISMFTVPTSRGRHNPCHSLSTWPVFFPLPLLFFLGFCRGKTK